MRRLRTVLKRKKRLRISNDPMTVARFTLLFSDKHFDDLSTERHRTTSDKRNRVKIVSTDQCAVRLLESLTVLPSRSV